MRMFCGTLQNHYSNLFKFICGFKLNKYLQVGVQPRTGKYIDMDTPAEEKETHE